MSAYISECYVWLYDASNQVNKNMGKPLNPQRPQSKTVGHCVKIISCDKQHWLRSLKAKLWFHVDATQGGYGPLTSLRTLYASTAMAAVHLPKIVTLRRGDAAARVVIGPLPNSRRKTKTGSRLRQSVCVVIALRRRGTVTEPLLCTIALQEGVLVASFICLYMFSQLFSRCQAVFFFFIQCLEIKMQLAPYNYLRMGLK